MSPTPLIKPLIPPKNGLFLGIQTLFVLGGWAIAQSIMGFDDFCSFALSSGLVLFSFFTLSVAVYWMFLKKSIALIIAGIVFKWPILIFAVLWATQYFEFKSVAFAVGALLWVPAGLVWHGLDTRE